MAEPARLSRKNDKSLPTLATELWELVVTYLKQETLEPLKGLGRFVGIGLAGAAALAIGLLLLAMALLRGLQAETVPHWSGSWSWLPYLITLVVSGAVAGIVASRITAVKRKKQGR